MRPATLALLVVLSALAVQILCVPIDVNIQFMSVNGSRTIEVDTDIGNLEDQVLRGLYGLQFPDHLPDHTEVMMLARDALDGLYGHPAASRAPVRRREGVAGCTYTYLGYRSSPLEAFWLENLDALFNGPKVQFCEALRASSGDFVYWVVHAGRAGTVTDWDPSLASVFSYFIYKEECPGLPPREIVSYIEPLAGPLRHPGSTCSTWREMVAQRTDYLVLPTINSPEATHLQRRAAPRTQAILVDLGASTWHSGAGGSSQDFFWGTYRRNGIELDRMLLWELTPHSGPRVMAEVPAEALHAYQYINEGVEAEPDSPKNPLNVIRRIARTDIDIDTFELEEALLGQLASSPDLLALVDELFFEGHGESCFHDEVWLAADETPVGAAPLSDVFRLFHRLREAGIRAHGWV